MEQGRGRAIALALCFVMGAALFPPVADRTLAADETPRLHLEQTRVEFGTVKPGVKVQRAIPLQNLGAADLEIHDMRLSVPGLTVKAPRVVPPHGDAEILLELDTAGSRGDVQARVSLRTNDPQAARVDIELRGRVESMVDLLPRPALFVSAFRWEADDKESTITVANRDERPLEIVAMEPRGDNFTVRLKVVEAGRRYELVAKVRGTGSSGMGLGQIVLRTNQGETIAIPVFTLLRDRTYLSPTEIDFGRIGRERSERQPDALQSKGETLYIYQYRAKDFRIQIDSAPSFVTIAKVPAEGPAAVVDIPRQGPTGVFELKIAPILERGGPGKREGTIRITTNDPETPELLVPVRVELE